MRLGLYRGKWCIIERGRDKDGKSITTRTSLGTADHGEAKRAFADYQAKAALPVGDAVEEIYAAYCRDLQARGGDRSRADTAWLSLAPKFGPLRPDQVTRLLCREYTAGRRLEKGKRGGQISDDTIRRELGCLSAALHWANKQSPAVIEMPPPSDPRYRPITADEERRLYDACVLPHLRLFARLALHTAGRRRALLDLTWMQVDFDRRIIRLAAGDGGRKKGRATVPMTETLFRELRDARRTAIAPTVIEYNGQPIKSIKTAWATALRRAGLANLRAHDLRHHAAIKMAEAGVSMSEIAQFLGHSDDRITSRVYARYSPNHLRKAAVALE